MIYTLSDPHQYLRDAPKKEDPFYEAIQLAKKHLQVDQDIESKCFLYGYIGNAYRVLSQLETALTYLQQALSLAKKSGNQSAEIVTWIRLGEAYKYNDNHSACLECLDHAEEIDPDHQYKDFILQHRGKCLLELGDYKERLKEY